MDSKYTNIITVALLYIVIVFKTLHYIRLQGGCNKVVLFKVATCTGPSLILKTGIYKKY